MYTIEQEATNVELAFNAKREVQKVFPEAEFRPRTSTGPGELFLTRTASLPLPALSYERESGGWLAVRDYFYKTGLLPKPE